MIDSNQNEFAGSMPVSESAPNWNWLKVEAGVFNGNGAPGVGGNVSDFDKMKELFKARIFE